MPKERIKAGPGRKIVASVPITVSLPKVLYQDASKYADDEGVDSLQNLIRISLRKMVPAGYARKNSINK